MSVANVRQEMGFHMIVMFSPPSRCSIAAEYVASGVAAYVCAFPRSRLLYFATPADDGNHSHASLMRELPAPAMF